MTDRIWKSHRTKEADVVDRDFLHNMHSHPAGGRRSAITNLQQHSRKKIAIN